MTDWIYCPRCHTPVDIGFICDGCLQLVDEDDEPEPEDNSDPP